MAKRTISNAQLTPDSIFLVRGKIGFARVSRLCTDEERARDNVRRMHKIDKNYTSISLYDAQVIAKDPANPSIEEKYGAECLYRSSSANYPGNNFSALNKSHILPKVGVFNPTTQVYDEIKPAGELATGLDVTVVMRVFKGQGNNGVSLDSVLVNEPIKYYQGASKVTNELKDRGIIFNALPIDRAAVSTPGIETIEDDDGNNGIVPNAFAPAAPAAAPTSEGNPFSSYTPGPANNAFGPGGRQY